MFSILRPGIYSILGEYLYMKMATDASSSFWRPEGTHSLPAHSTPLLPEPHLYENCV